MALSVSCSLYYLPKTRAYTDTAVPLPLYMPHCVPVSRRGGGDDAPSSEYKSYDAVGGKGSGADELVVDAPVALRQRSSHPAEPGPDHTSKKQSSLQI